MLRVVAWETTRRCASNCLHCRGAARDSDYAGELTGAEGVRLIDAIASFARPVLILTGGDPLGRADIYELAAHAVRRGLRTVVAACGRGVDKASARRMLEAGVSRISISVDGATAESHDAFRGEPGAFEAAMRAMGFAREAGLEFQVNTTVSRHNVSGLPEILELARSAGAAAWDVFFLVPTGRGAGLRGQELSPLEYEQTLQWIAAAAGDSKIPVKTTCAPHYARIAPGGGPGRRQSSGCMAGQGFVFVSHRGELQPCGFLDIACGNLRDFDFDFKKIYDESVVFRALRKLGQYKGKCGGCRYLRVCGGCRARAYAATGDFLAEEPNCAYPACG